jgi:hypothetical protein
MAGERPTATSIQTPSMWRAEPASGVQALEAHRGQDLGHETTQLGDGVEVEGDVLDAGINGARPTVR